MTEEHRLRLALDLLHAGLGQLHAGDADFANDVLPTLPDETAEVEDAIVMLARAARETEALAAAAKQMAQETAARARRFAEREQRFRALIFSAMEAIGREKIQRPDLTISLRPARPSVRITDETALPAEYWRIERKPNLTAIGDDLRQGVVIDGAELANGLPSLIIKGT